MPNKTANYGLTKPLATENYSINDQNGNMDIIDKGLVIYLGATSGSANIYALSSEVLEGLSEGIAICVKFHVASTSASTLNINSLGAKAIKKPGGADVTNLKVGLYTLRYDGTNFILQGEGASGDATASDLLLGKKATTDAGEIIGTMPDNGPVEAETVNLTSEGAEYVIPEGCHSGLRKIKAAITGLIASVIKAGTTVGGILGTFTADATTTAGDMLLGKTAYVNGSKITGTIPSKGTATITPGTTNQSIAANQYLSGAQTILGDPNLVPGNIKKDVNIFNVTGTLIDGTGLKRTASGTATVTYSTAIFDGQMLQFLEVTGLTFLPRLITIKTAEVSGYRSYTYYNGNIPGYYTKEAITGRYINGMTNQQAYCINAANAPAYVTNGSFKLPIYSAAITMTVSWSAEE